MTTNTKGTTDMRMGMRLFSAVSVAEVIVVKAAEGQLLCAGAPMTETPERDRTTGDGPTVEMGKRYEDETSGLLVMCTKPGTGPLSVDGRELTPVKSKPLPSSD